MSVLKKYDKQVEEGRITPVENQVQKQSDLRDSFSKTNFDVENPQPLGGTKPTPYEVSKANFKFKVKNQRTIQQKRALKNVR